jgi:hypothetical protein
MSTRAYEVLKVLTDCPCETCVAVKKNPNQVYCLYCGNIQHTDHVCRGCGGCPNCAPHHVCVMCDVEFCAYMVATCRICGYCVTHCHCERCSGCHSWFVPTQGRFHNGRTVLPCTRCVRCVSCGCRCRQQDGATKKAKKEYAQRISPATIAVKPGAFKNLAGVVFHLSDKTQFKRNPLKRLLSCELEVAGLRPDLVKAGVSPLDYNPRTLDINKTLLKWNSQIVEDVSLPPKGFEINTAPANGDLFLDLMGDVTNVLNLYGATCTNDYDDRKRVEPCGMHVHVDARDVDYHDLRRFLLLYELVEPALYEMLPGRRRNSHFCVPCGNLYGHMVRRGLPIRPGKQKGKYDPAKVHLIDAVYADTIPDRSDKRACLQDARYRALNVHAWFYRRTLEFRHMYGTVKAYEATSWARVVGNVVDFAIRTPHSTIEEMRSEFKGKSKGALLRVLEKESALVEFMQAQVEAFKNSNEQESPVLGHVRGPRRAQEEPEFTDGTFWTAMRATDGARIIRERPEPGGVLRWTHLPTNNTFVVEGTGGFGVDVPPTPEAIVGMAIDEEAGD